MPSNLLTHNDSSITQVLLKLKRISNRVRLTMNNQLSPQSILVHTKNPSMITNSNLLIMPTNHNDQLSNMNIPRIPYGHQQPLCGAPRSHTIPRITLDSDIKHSRPPSRHIFRRKTRGVISITKNPSRQTAEIITAFNGGIMILSSRSLRSPITHVHRILNYNRTNIRYIIRRSTGNQLSRSIASHTPSTLPAA